MPARDRLFDLVGVRTGSRTVRRRHGLPSYLEARECRHLGNRGASLQIIGPAGRRAVAVNANWWNPYLDNANRVRDREAMLRALTESAGEGPEECARMAGPPLQLMYSFGTLCVYVVK